MPKDDLAFLFGLLGCQNIEPPPLTDNVSILTIPSKTSLASSLTIVHQFRKLLADSVNNTVWEYQVACLIIGPEIGQDAFFLKGIGRKDVEERERVRWKSGGPFDLWGK